MRRPAIGVSADTRTTILGLLAAALGTGVAPCFAEGVPGATATVLSESRVLASHRDQIHRLGWVYQAGRERVVMFDRPVADPVGIARTGDVTVYQYQEPLFDTWGTGQCPGAIELFGQVLPGNGGAPVYEAWEGTAQFEANTVIDTIGFACSALNEAPATAGDSMTDGVPFNDVVIVVEDRENAVQNNSTPTLRRFGVAVLGLAGSDFPPPAGQVDVFNYTIDLTADPGIADDGVEFEVGDDDSVAAEACIQSDDFNPNAFLDAGLVADFAPEASDSLHDASFTMFFLQPLFDYSGQIDPRDPVELAQVRAQGFLLGFGAGWADYNPFDPDDSFPSISEQVQGNGVGALDLIRRWDLTQLDLTADPFEAEFFDEDGPANLGGGQRIVSDERVAFFDANPFLSDLGLEPDRIVCDGLPLTSPDGTMTVFLDTKGGSEPYISFWGPIPGTCGAPVFSGCVPGSGRSCPPDLARPFEILDLSDVDAFIFLFLTGDMCADFAPPQGVFDLSDIDVFISGFLAGCG
ncbi:MAG: GC-type dockerin domain-anchored protein [Planctomycetota bacterium]